MAPPPEMASVKTIAETPNLATIPSAYVFSGGVQAAPQGTEMEDSTIPTIDFSLLTAGTPDDRAEAIAELGRACEDWGFFMVINHGVPERVREEMVDVCREFFDLPEEEKREYETMHVLDPIRYGTSFNPQKEKVFFWRDYLKMMVHPKFHCPRNPPRFREISEEYCRRVREMTVELMRGVSESLGLEASNLERALNLESCSQILAVNLYPPCPQPELAMGLPPHSDHCLLTVLLQNHISGLQILHHGNWVDVKPIPNSFLVNTADQLEILSNGKYKSVLHRAIVNNKATRVSIPLTLGPSLETVVGPLPELVDQHNPPSFNTIKYKDYLEIMQSGQLEHKYALDRIRLL